MRIENRYIIVPRTVADGRTPINKCNVRICDDHDTAVHIGQSRIDRRTYDGSVIYKAITLVRRTAPPIDVIPVGEDGEVLEPPEHRT